MGRGVSKTFKTVGLDTTVKLFLLINLEKWLDVEPFGNGTLQRVTSEHGMKPLITMVTSGKFARNLITEPKPTTPLTRMETLRGAGNVADD